MTFSNRLANEKSPYLLQHAHNPVDWYPWGEEAFAAAEKEGKPIFLSIGYATCHWCHVMESETFASPELAKLMNETFINIKVDREELPQVDSVYMDFAQAIMSSAGGWPLNLILTPELKPLFAVTYLPPKTRRGLMGMDEFIAQIRALWQSEERPRLLEQADKIIELFEQTTTRLRGGELPDAAFLSQGIEILFDMADPVYGGIKGEPKFPLGYQVQLFLQHAQLKEDSRSLFYAELTLDMMARGGIYDHLAGGFSRYSVDDRWVVPHFEKMLYDNAILGRAYLDASVYTKKPVYRRVCEQVISYLLREMAHPEGGFYSAEDADIEGKEGAYYTWTPQEIEEVLGKEEALLFSRCYGVTTHGNLEGRSILHLEVPLEELDDALQERLAHAREQLLERRKKRPSPFKDDKIISGWNGLVIDFLAQAASAFDNPTYGKAALDTAIFVRDRLWKEGRLLRRYRDNDSRFTACLDDYVCMIKGLLSLFEQGMGTEWLEWALEMVEVVDKEFKSEDGAFYYTVASSTVLVRKCEFYDGAEPSGNAVHCENLLRLHQITMEESYLLQAERILKAARGHLEAFPPGACYHLLNLQHYLDNEAPTLIIAFNESKSDEAEIRSALRSNVVPHRIVVWRYPGDVALESSIPEITEKPAVDGKTTLYVCRQGRCEPPVTGKEEIIKAIEGM